MADLSELYDATRADLSEFLSELPDEDLERRVPATPEWTIRDVVAHHAGGVVDTAAGNFPKEFFFALGSEEGVATLNEWTERQVEERRGRPLREVLDEWKEATAAIAPMIRGDVAWPDEMMAFAGQILMTDLAIHQQDIYGALGIVKDRDAAPMRVGFATYVVGVDLRLKGSGKPSIRFVAEQKDVTAGGGDPVATVRAPRFELFRALSGRRSPDQIRAYDWEGDPEPFLEFFYPYGIREEPLVE